MIVDSLKNCRSYFSLHPLFMEAFEFLADSAAGSLALGKHEIGTRGAYAIVDEYQTKDASAGTLECHRKYIDIQYVVRGSERIGVCSKDRCRAREYDETKDLQMLEGDADLITLGPGWFAVFMPQDAHLPGLRHGDKTENVRKVVVKVPV
jgi:biofilm protein TabA